MGASLAMIGTAAALGTAGAAATVGVNMALNRPSTTGQGGEMRNLSSLFGAGGQQGGLLQNPFSGGTRSLLKLLPSIIGSGGSGPGLMAKTGGGGSPIAEGPPALMQQVADANPQPLQEQATGGLRDLIGSVVQSTKSVMGDKGVMGQVLKDAGRTITGGASKGDFFLELGGNLAARAQHQRDEEARLDQLRALSRRQSPNLGGFQNLTPNALSGLGGLASGGFR